MIRAHRLYSAYVPVLRVIAAVIAFSPAAWAAGGLQFIHTSWDFGTVGATEKKEHAFPFRNGGEKSVGIVSVIPSCGCTAVVAGKKAIQPGETGEIMVTFDPSGKSGRLESTVEVTADDGGKTALTLAADIKTLEGDHIAVTPPVPSIKVSPQSVNLGKLKRGKAALYRIVVENVGDGELFLYGMPERNEAGLPLSQKPIGKSRKIEITFFYQGDKKGKIKDSVVIRSNDPVRPEVSISLTGVAE